MGRCHPQVLPSLYTRGKRVENGGAGKTFSSTLVSHRQRQRMHRLIRHLAYFLKPMTDDPSSLSKKLVRETPFVCHAFSHEFFLVRETCSKLVTALFRPRNLGVTRLKSSGLIGHQVMFRNKVVFTSKYI